MSNSDNFRFNSRSSIWKSGQLAFIALIFCFLILLALFPVSAANTSEGMALYKAGKYNQSIDWFQNTLKGVNGTNRAPLLNNIGASNLALKKYDDAKKNFEEAVKANSSYGPAWMNLAKVNEVTKNTEEAIKCYDEAIKVDPTTAAAILIKKGSLLFNLRRYDDALSAYQDAEPIATKKEQQALYISMGGVYLKQKNKYGAEQALNHAIELDPANASMAYYNLGVLRTSELKYDEAKAALEQALKINPSLKMASEELEKVNKSIANNT